MAEATPTHEPTQNQSAAVVISRWDSSAQRNHELSGAMPSGNSVAIVWLWRVLHSLVADSHGAASDLLSGRRGPETSTLRMACKPPSREHPFGTDDLGRDLLARVLYGGRISIAVGIVAVIISMSLGTMIGAISGFFGGFTDSALMRFVDMMLSLPTLPLLLLVIYLFRDSMRDRFGLEVGMFILIVGIIGVLSWMPVCPSWCGHRSCQSRRRSSSRPRTASARTRSSIIFKHILPNALGPVIVAATFGVGAAIITESSLSFLGLGFPPDVPTWGRLLFDNKDWMELAWWMVVFPGMAIFLTVLSINYVGDGLRDALDPHRTTS